MEILKVLALVLAIFLTVFILSNFKKGMVLNLPSVIKTPQIRFNRSENPISFGSVLVSYALMIILLVLFGLGLI